jgi:UDP-glucose 4-epimerase
VPRKLAITECTPQTPINPYGETKLMVEKILRWYREAHGLHAVCLRYFNAAGSDTERHIGECHYPKTHLIPLAIQTALDERPFLDVHGTDYDTHDGTAIRDYVHVSDLADAHVKALRYLLAGEVSCALSNALLIRVIHVHLLLQHESQLRMPVAFQALRDLLPVARTLGWLSAASFSRSRITCALPSRW